MARPFRPSVLIFTLAVLVSSSLSLARASPADASSSHASWPEVSWSEFRKIMDTGEESSLPETLYLADSFKGPVPTNSWWSSLLFTPHSGRMYSLPLAFACQAEGLEVTYPVKRVTGTASAGFWEQTDLLIGAPAFRSQDARLKNAWDWSLDVQMRDTNKSITARLLTG